MLLLDAYLKTLSGDKSRREAIRDCSALFRKMAISAGNEIDESYRSVNGISFQMASMESAYQGHTIIKPASRLFTETVLLYRNNTKRYKQLLMEANNMVSTKDYTKSSKENEFITWLAGKVSGAQLSELYIALQEIEQQAKKDKIVRTSLYESLDPSSVKIIKAKIESCKIFKFKHKRQWGRIASALNYLLQYAKTTATNDVFKSSEENQENIRISTPDSSTDDRIDKFNEWLVENKNSAYTKERLVTAFTIGSDYGKNVLGFEGNLWDISDASDFEKSYLMIVDSSFKTEHSVLLFPFITACKHFIKWLGSRSNQEDAYTFSQISPKEVSANCDIVDVNPNEKKSGIQQILVERYQYGFRYDSLRELMRFRQFAEASGVTLPENDEQLKAAIMASGTVIEDKVFCKSDNLPIELQNLVDEVFASGTSTIYYECLLQDKSDWMNAHTITSESILKEYLRKYIKGCSFAKKFMVKGSKKTEKQAVTEEIKRVWGNGQTESVNVLSERLPYIPLGNIWRVISGNDLFVLSSEGVYLLVDRFIISQDEIEDILDYVDAVCEEKDFCSLSDIPLGDIEENNYELSKLAIYNAAYRVALASKYHLNGKILTKDKPELDAVLLLKQDIRGLSECNFDEVSEKVIELTGSTNRQYAFQALYDEMVRVDKNRFVSNKAVNFEVNEIDKVLSTFITDHFAAIRDVTTFAMFPICGQNWNHYLLESFCYKYSRRYSLHVIHFNDKNAGIIAEKDYNKSYAEMLAIQLARSDVELKPEIIGPYLFDTGYMAKSKYAKLDEIAQQAKELRKEG